MSEILLRTLAHVWTALEPMRVPMALMGGLALATWKHVRATRDVDLLLGLAPHDLAWLLQTLSRAGVRPKAESPTTRLGQIELLECVYEPPESFLELQVDLLFGQSPYHRKALDRALRTDLSGLGFPILVLSCEDLVLHKLLAGRLIDRYDASILLRVNRQQLDLGYIALWARDLGIVSEWAGLWQEVFPGEALPAHPTI